jgi:two-component system LytT family response regulator
MIKAIIIDDEIVLRDLNKALLNKHFPEIAVVAVCGTVDEGVEMIDELQPELILLDIRLSDGTGFNILQQIKPYNYSVIFITAYNEFAIKAIRFSAIDYILKPVDEQEFCDAVDRAISSRSNNQLHQQVETFFNYFERKTQQRRLVLKTADTMHLVDVVDITYCRSDSNYTTFFFHNREKILVTRVMKEYEDLLAEYGFFRPHHSFLVNLQYVSKLDKTDGGFLVLKDGTELPISLRRKRKLIQVLEQF